MNDTRIQRAQESDLDKVIQLTLEAFGPVSFESNIESDFGLINGTSWQIRKSDHIREDFADPDGLVLLAKIAERDGHHYGPAEEDRCDLLGLAACLDDNERDQAAHPDQARGAQGEAQPAEHHQQADRAPGPQVGVPDPGQD